jgi:hypothetical protein
MRNVRAADEFRASISRSSAPRRTVTCLRQAADWNQHTDDVLDPAGMIGVTPVGECCLVTLLYRDRVSHEVSGATLMVSSG